MDRQSLNGKPQQNAVKQPSFNLCYLSSSRTSNKQAW
jgi:hypothetical protein